MSLFSQMLRRIFTKSDTPVRIPQKTKSRSRLLTSLRPGFLSLEDRTAPAADLSIIASGGATGVAGTNVTFTVTVSNIGADPASDVSVQDLLPSDFVSISQLQTSGPAFTLGLAGNQITNTIATLNSGDSAVFEISGTIKSSSPNNGNLSQTVSVSTSSIDSDPNNDSAQITTVVSTEADVSITQTGPANAVSKDTLTYFITITNAGPSDAQSVTFADNLPNGLKLISTTQTSGPTLPGVLQPGDVAKYTVVASVKPSTQDGTLSNVVTVQTTTNDPTPGNNTAKVDTTIEQQSLSVSLDGSSNLVVTDNLGSDNSLTYVDDGANIVITDAVQRFANSTIPGAVRSNGDRTLTIPYASISGATIQFDTGDGDDTLTVSMTGSGLTKNIIFNGGTQNKEDTLVVNGGSFTRVTNNLTNANDGSIRLDAKTIQYTGLEPVLLNLGSVTDYVFNLPAVSSNAVLEDNGTIADGLSQLRSANGTFEVTTFTNPTGSLTINRGTATDNLSISALPDFDATLAAGTIATPFAQLDVTGNVNATSATSTKTISLNGNNLALNGQLNATTALNVYAKTSATQSAPFTTGLLTIGALGNTGNYTFTNANNDVTSVASGGAGTIKLTDKNALDIQGVSAKSVVFISAANMTISGDLAATTDAKLITGTTATQAAKIATPSLILGDAGNTGSYTLTFATNDIGDIQSLGATAISLVDSSALTVSGITATAGVDLKTTSSMDVKANVTGSPVTLEAGTDLTFSFSQNNTIGNITAKAGNTLTVLPGQSIAVAAGKSIALEVDTVGAIDATGGTINLIGADLKASTVVNLTGGSEDDTFKVSKFTTNVFIDGKAPNTAPGDTIVADGQGVNDFTYTGPQSFLLGGGTVSFNNIETVTVQNVPAYNVDPSISADDVLTLELNATNQPIFTLNADPTVILPAGLATFRFHSGDGSDTMIVKMRSGQSFPIGNIVYDGQGAVGDRDKLAVIGSKVLSGSFDPNQNVVVNLAPTALDQGQGTLKLGTGLLTFTGLDANGGGIDIAGMSTATLTFAGTDDNLTVSDPVLANNVSFTGTNDAIRISGSTKIAGVATNIETVAVYQNQSVVIDPTTNKGTNNILINKTKLKAQHANDSLTIVNKNTISGDFDVNNVTIAGSLSFNANLTVNADGILVNADIDAGQTIAMNNRGILTINDKTLTSGVSFIQTGGNVVIPTGITKIDSGSIDFAGQIDSSATELGKLETHSTGTTTFHSVIGSNHPLFSLVTNKDGATVFQENSVKTVNLQSYGNPVTVQNTNVQFLGTAPGDIQFHDKLNPTLTGTDLKVGGAGVIVSFDKTVGGDTPFRNINIPNAVNVTTNGVNAETFTQTTGTGTTTLGGAFVITGGTPGAIDYQSGGAINIKTSAAKLTGDISALNNPVVLQLANGADQSGGSLKTTQLFLTGSGTFKIDSSANVLSGNTKGDLFADLTSGSITVRDSSNLELHLFDVSKPAIRIAGAAPSLKLITDLDFTATYLTPTTQNMIDVTSSGTVQVKVGVTRIPNDPAAVTNVKYAVESLAQSVTLGTPILSADFPNQAKDIFTVRPMKNAKLLVDGHNPIIGSLDNTGQPLTPYDTLITNFDGIGSVNLAPNGPTGGTYSFPGTGYQDLVYESIETLGGLQGEAAVVQTAPVTGDPSNKYIIKVSLTQRNESGTLSSIGKPLTGAVAVGNPFIVSPNLVSDQVPFSPPKVTLASVTGNAIPDLIIVGGPGDLPLVTIINGSRISSPTTTFDLNNLKKEDLVAQFYAFNDPTFRGGLTVAAADFDNDGHAEIIVGAGVGGGPRIAAYKIDSGANKDPYNNASVYVDKVTNAHYDFFAYESSFRGGVNVSAGDFNQDGTPDIVAGAGVGGGPRVRVFDGKNKDSVISDFFAYESAFRGGVLVSAGQFDNDNFEDLVTAPGSGGGPRVRVFKGDGVASHLSNDVIVDFFAFPITTSLIPGESSTQTGIGAIALGNSTDNAGHSRVLLVSSPRGQSVQILRFAPLPKADKTLEPISLDPLKDTVDGLSNPLLRDGGTVGGYTVES
ncbi:MAG: hypothetical protein U0798_16125 [Gemmataceae bacterium]